MKKLLLFAIITIFTIGYNLKVSAQDTKTANAGGEILSPIQLTLGTPLEFGTWAKIGAGTVTIEPSSDINLESTGDLTEVNSSTNTRTAASFTVNGTSGYTYVIQVDDEITINNAVSGGGNMTVDLTVKSVSTNVEGELNGTLQNVAGVGTDVFYIGGTMNVEAADVAGRYSTTFDVTVNYN